jgi:DNA-directed RNA polymerase specialized sigma24 family protein
MTTTHHPADFAGSGGFAGSGSRALRAAELRSNHSLLVRLTSEWRRLAVDRERVAQALAWGLPFDFDTLDDILVAGGWYRSAGERGRTGSARASSDVVLHALLVAARDDELAARVVLQRLLPGLVTLACRWQRRYDGDVVSELLAAAWPVIRTFPYERRPQHLVANLLNDCEYHAFRRANRRLMQQVATAPHELDCPVEPPPPDARAELAEVISCSRQLSEDDRYLLALLASGRSMLEVAGALAMSERTLRNHKARVMAHLRSAVALAGAA